MATFKRKQHVMANNPRLIYPMKIINVRTVLAAGTFYDCAFLNGEPAGIFTERELRKIPKR